MKKLIINLLGMICLFGSGPSQGYINETGFPNMEIDVVVICLKKHNLNYTLKECIDGSFNLLNHLSDFQTDKNKPFEIITYQNENNLSRKEWTEQAYSLAKTFPNSTVVIGIQKLEELQAQGNNQNMDGAFDIKQEQINALGAFHIGLLEVVEKDVPHARCIHISGDNKSDIYKGSLEKMSKRDQKRMEQFFCCKEMPQVESLSQENKNVCVGKEAVFIMEKLIDATNLYEEYRMAIDSAQTTMSTLSNLSKKSLRLSKSLKSLNPTQKELVENLIVFTDLFTSLVDQTMQLTIENSSIHNTIKSKQTVSPYNKQKVHQLEGSLTKTVVACTGLLDRISFPISLEYGPLLTAEEKTLLSSRIHSKGKMLAAEYYSQIADARASSSAAPKIEGSYRASMSIYGVLNDKTDILVPAQLQKYVDLQQK
jgi:hypothetical protein